VEATAKNFPLGWIVVGTDFTDATINPTAMPVSVSLSTTTEPATYVPATWATQTSTNPDTYWIVLEVSGAGTGGTHEYAGATYHAFAKIIDGTRTIVLPLGLVTVG
jgi:hypothetical protein